MTLCFSVLCDYCYYCDIFAQNSFAYNRRCNKEVERRFFLFCFLAIRQSHEPYNYDPTPPPTLRRLACCTHTSCKARRRGNFVFVPLNSKISTHTHTEREVYLPHTHTHSHVWKLLRGQILIVFVAVFLLFVLLHSSLTYPHIIGINVFRFVIISLTLQHHTRLRKRNHVRVAAVSSLRLRSVIADGRFIHSHQDKVELIRKQKSNEREKAEKY